MKFGKIHSNSATFTRLCWLLNVERASNIRCLSSCCYLCALVGGTSVFGNCEHLCENQMRKNQKKNLVQNLHGEALNTAFWEKRKQEVNVWGSNVAQDVGSINEKEKISVLSPKWWIPHRSNHITVTQRMWWVPGKSKTSTVLCLNRQCFRVECQRGLRCERVVIQQERCSAGQQNTLHPNSISYLGLSLHNQNQNHTESAFTRARGSVCMCVFLLGGCEDGPVNLNQEARKHSYTNELKRSSEIPRDGRQTNWLICQQNSLEGRL